MVTRGPFQHKTPTLLHHTHSVIFYALKGPAMSLQTRWPGALSRKPWQDRTTTLSFPVFHYNIIGDRVYSAPPKEHRGLPEIIMARPVWYLENGSPRSHSPLRLFQGVY